MYFNGKGLIVELGGAGRSSHIKSTRFIEIGISEWPAASRAVSRAVNSLYGKSIGSTPMRDPDGNVLINQSAWEGVVLTPATKTIQLQLKIVTKNT